MQEWNAEDLAQRVFDLGLVDQRQIEIVWSELGTRDVSHEQFSDRLLNKELLTNFQLDKVLKGDRVGFFYGKYRVLYMVGAGTFARVFRAVHTKDDRVVALKVLRRRYRNEPEQVELFLREARMGERLRHVNIVRVHDVSSDIRAPYMVMEFIEGQTLREFMRMRKKLDPDTALNLMTDIVTGLDHARKRGITHRDMKLSNVLVTSTGRAKLVDFGLATISEVKEELMAAAPNARSIDYVALERGTGVPKNDHRSDIYFAGCMFYHMLTGEPPLVETRDRLIRMSVSRFQEIKPITQLDPDLPASVTSVVNRAMCFDPKARYQEADQMLVDLKRTKFVLEKGEERAASLEQAELPDELKRPADTEGKGYTVMVVESKMEMQDIMRDQLKKRGYRVLITGNPGRAIQRFEDEIQIADCAVFSTQELGAQAVAAFNKLGELEETRHTPAILMVDKRHKELTEAANTNEHRILLPMPLKMTQLRSALRKLLAASSENS
jgi:serine/threonine-protein kinase